MPVVEPEVLMDGEHTVERCGEVTEEVLRTLFHQLYTQGVLLGGPDPSACKMVLSGLSCPKQAPVDEVADATVRVPEPSPQPCRALPSCRAANRLIWLRLV